MLERLRNRLRSAPDPVSEVLAERGVPVDLGRYPGIIAFLESGDMVAARSLVDQVDPSLSGAERARIDLQLRHDAFRRAAARPAAAQWPPSADQSAQQLSGRIPEINADALDADTLIAAVRGSGALIVRGLVSESFCAQARDAIDAALANLSAPEEQRDPRWHTALADLNGDAVSVTYRANGYRTFDGQVPVADAPAAADMILAEFDARGVPDLVEKYLGEQPAVTLEKWTLRRVPPEANTSWHQDGAFLGPEIHTVNMWIALSDCGQDASGLDIVAKRFDEIVATGTSGAYFDWDVAPEVVESERGDNPVVSPVFAPGDAVFFDQFLLHRTGISPGMTQDRYALESWFFAPSSYPDHYSGLLV